MFFYKGPSAASLFRDDDDDDDDDEEMVKETDGGLATSSDDARLMRLLTTPSSLRTSPTYSEEEEDAPPSLPTPPSVSSIASSTDASALLPSRIPWLRSAPDWRSWIAVLLSQRQKIEVTQRLPPRGDVSAEQIEKDLRRETLSINGTILEPTTSAKALDDALRKVLRTRAARSSISGHLRWIKASATRTVSGFDSFERATDFFRAACDDVLLTPAHDSGRPPTEIEISDDCTETRTYNDYNVLKRSFHEPGLETSPDEPRLVLRTVVTERRPRPRSRSRSSSPTESSSSSSSSTASATASATATALTTTRELRFRLRHSDPVSPRRRRRSEPAVSPNDDETTTTTTSLASAILGSADVAYTWMRQTHQRVAAAVDSRAHRPSELRFFTRGYGDVAELRKLRANLLREWTRDGLETWFRRCGALRLEWDATTGCGPPPGVEPERHGLFLSSASPSSATTTTTSSFFSAAAATTSAAATTTTTTTTTTATSRPYGDKCDVFDATFRSPLSRHLPLRSRVGHVRFVLPSSASSSSAPLRGIALHTAATGEEGYEGRIERLALPLLERGIASMILCVPFYGRRRPKGQAMSFVRTVAEYGLQSLATVLEGVALLRWLRDKYPDTPLVVTGISWGGGTAACVGALCRMPRVACVPCLGCASARAMVAGIIQWQVDWDRLREEVTESAAKSDGERSTLAEAKASLQREFQSFTLETIVSGRPKDAAKIPVMIQVSAVDDHYVTAEEGKALYAALEPACEIAELRWVQGGHVTGFVRAARDFLPAIVKAIEAIE